MSIYNPNTGGFIRFPSPEQLTEFSDWETHPDDYNPPPFVPPPSPDYEGFFLSVREQWRSLLNLTTAQAGDVGALQTWIARLPIDPAMAGAFIADWNTVAAALPANHGIDFSVVVSAAGVHHVPLFGLVDPVSGLLPTG